MPGKNELLGIVLDGWVDALRGHDLATIERHLRPDTVWQGVRSDLCCPDRTHILANLGRDGGQLPEVDGIDLYAAADQVLLGVRSPDLTEVGGEPLDGEIHSVFTIDAGLIARIEEFKTRGEALAAMQAHREAAGATDAPPPAVPESPVNALVPFVHVADVERSIAFYGLLGFAVDATFGPSGRLGWASLASGEARLMLARADEPIDPAGQGVLFYLYAPVLEAVQRHLRGHGAQAGQIRDGSPGPRREMRLRDPDGYCLMVAETATPEAEPRP
jgi:ketosteroid isomerase-like protein/catechol 2,3-dioxygenase-like lactoylglutathione lyase family enzyme